MFPRGVPTGRSPKIVARLMTVVSVRKKSSAVSVSIFPGLGRRESAPSAPLGVPVAKKNGAAHRGVVRHTLNANATPIKLARDIADFFAVLITFVLPFFGRLS
jgi:hypothetical protein